MDEAALVQSCDILNGYNDGSRAPPRTADTWSAYLGPEDLLPKQL